METINENANSSNLIPNLECSEEYLSINKSPISDNSECLKDSYLNKSNYEKHSTEENDRLSIISSISNDDMLENNVVTKDIDNSMLIKKFDSLSNSNINIKLENENDNFMHIKNLKGYSEENIINEICMLNTKKNDEFARKEIIQRRNSLPENYANSLSFYTNATSNNIDSFVESQSSTSMSRYSDVTNDINKYNDKKNLSNVVKNVHGLFSYVGGSLKNAYKPMEKNISGMMQATQRNLTNVKNDYLKADKTPERFLIKNCDVEDIFKKCEKTNNSSDTTININDDIPKKTLNTELILNNNESEEKNSLNDIDFKHDEQHKDPYVIKLEDNVKKLDKEVEAFKLMMLDKDAVKRNLESKLNIFMKQLDAVKSERDTIVVKYALSEKSALEALMARDKALGLESSMKHEMSMLTQRLRTANAERTRASSSLDIKCHELSSAQKEISKLKEEMQSCDVKLKWAQSKLMSEMDAHKESSALVEKLTAQLKQIEGGGNVPLTYQSISPNDADNLVREKEAMIILERHERERHESRCKVLQSDVDQLKNSLNSATKEVRELRAQIESATAESAALRRACSELREQGAKDCERLAAAQARAARCDILTAQLQQEQDRYSKLAQEFEAMKTLREEALAENELRARREAELLRQSERLTVAGVKLQAASSEAEAKALALTVDNNALRDAATRAVAEAAEFRAEAMREKEGRAADARALASRAAQHARGEREALAALEAARGELRVISTKYASSLKELKRELQQARRKNEKFESEDKNSPQLSLGKRVGSSSSLSSFEGIANNITSEAAHSAPELPPKTAENQQLVERIVTLQKTAAKRTEKLEFLEEHNRQLTQELQRKTRILRGLLVSVPSVGLSSTASDNVKAEISRHGGVMASVFGSQITDDTMTLELSLEINAKLQNLLEDTLLSNITLKENMDTLGDEITRLKEERKRLK